MRHFHLGEAMCQLGLGDEAVISGDIESYECFLEVRDENEYWE